MAATFVVETGAGVAGANSYLSVADADQYHENVGTAAASWGSLTDAVKQQALRDATMYLDGLYGTRWRGRRTTRENPLDWPRVGVDDTDGYSVDSDDLPVGLENATAAAALLATTETLAPDLTTPGGVTRIEEKLGPIARTRVYETPGLVQFKRYTVVERHLHDLIEPAGSRMLDRA